jgi:molybdopterin-guanine dinucleotide biosynthesis protein B
VKLFSVIGISLTGKTTTIENIIKELKKRRYSVGSVKEIHFEDFAIDEEGTNTYRHSKAGAEPVTARGYYETDILYKERLSLEKILKNYAQDYVILEGVEDGNFPKIITAKNKDEIEQKMDDMVFAISGKISEELDQYKGIPVIDGISESEKLVNLIEEKVFEKLPDFPADCCTACGFTCRELGKKILQGEAKREDCVISDTNTKLFINDNEIEMVPFVQKLLYNAVHGVVSELEGYQEGADIRIEIGNINRD